MSDSAQDVLKPLRDSIVNKPPYVSGTLSLSPDDLRLYYDGSGSASSIDFTKATEEQLAALSRACRKNGRRSLRYAHVPERTDLHTIIRNDLLEGENSTRPIRFELYKLNVYGKDSFFKAHIDTPRSETMFGSLVLVYPTEHEGGALVLRHRGEEWTFDSAQAVKNQATTSIGYVAFFSDVEHEVSHVQAGYRVTLTFNVYYDDVGAVEVPPTTVANHTSIKTEMEALLRDPTFLPSGGLLGFGLQHVYPIEKTLNHVHKVLKGSDAVVWRVCSELSAEPKIYLVYGNPKDDYYRVIIDKVVKENDALEDGFIYRLLEDKRAIMVEDFIHGAKAKNVTPVTWVMTPEATRTKVKTPFIAYGNEAWLACTYGEACIIASVPAFEIRQQA
ncbi:hypothetical protein EWM64_g9383 [Hericium alpestre]|uniref:Prolyl 4-hydroxylase alpha subunit Fe(2+) 2OG dioxygenase domain-containing protein n=1 Tax=Hericium alpestre TaxID=135208 RepID=A0A4Y9ZKR4_9AGAM|nr:hypothetical protein EWM64_g9383 [Hericium alpestre]